MSWQMAEYLGYKPLTTLWEDFSIAESFGTAAIKDTASRAFNAWKNNYKYLTELIMVIKTTQSTQRVLFILFFVVFP